MRTREEAEEDLQNIQEDLLSHGYKELSHGKMKKGMAVVVPFLICYTSGSYGVYVDRFTIAESDMVRNACRSFPIQKETKLFIKK